MRRRWRFCLSRFILAERAMDRTYFRLHHASQQTGAACVILALIAVSRTPFSMYSLDLPKTIINDAMSNSAGGRVFGVGPQLDQVTYLFSLCGIFLVLVLINGGFKYVINVYRGVVGERMLRRLRYELYSRVMRFPLPHFRRVSQGELVQMITAEVEPLGGFMAQAFSMPAYQGGHASDDPVLHVHPGLGARPRRHRALPAADLADPEAAAPGQPAWQGAGAPGPQVWRSGSARPPKACARHSCQ